MKRFSAPIFLLFLAVAPLHSATNITSNLSSDTLWDRSGSPYLLSGKIVVPAGTILKVGPGAQVIFQGASVLEVNGSLQVVGSAAAPAVFNMIEGGLQSELFINGGEARISNAKIQSGMFLVRDSKLSMEGVDVTKGSGVYLQGSTTASLKGNKIYGNSAGLVLDGSVRASVQFNTLVSNSDGLLIKNYSSLTFRNNSVHDNQQEVVNGGQSVDLGGNYWGTSDAGSLKSKIQGNVDTTPMKGLKDVLRAYIRTQLPTITKKMSDDLVAREKKEAKESAATLKKLKKAKEEPQAVKTLPGQPAATTPSAEVPAETPVTEAAPAAVESAPVQPAPFAEGKAQKVPVTPLTPATRTLKPLALPPDQGDVASTPSAPLPAGEPPADMAVPAAAAPAASTTASTEPPAMPGSDNIAPPDLETMAPPALDSSAPATAPPAVPASGDNGVIPPPPSGSDQSAAPSVPGTTAPAPEPPAAPPLPPPTTEEKNAADKLNKDVQGDIDGMQAPPLDLFGDLSNVPTPVDNPKTKKPTDPDISLPPLQDTDIAPPKDLDLPPADDLGNINLDSKQ